MENEIHSGGNPVRAGICHCRYCQTRTGSAFGISVYFKENQINLINGELTEYNFTNSSGRSFKNKFCKTCGTTVLWEVELRKGLIGVGGGTFDPPTFWYEAGFEVFCRSKAPFVETSISEKHETTDYYKPIAPNNTSLEKHETTEYYKPIAPNNTSLKGKQII